MAFIIVETAHGKVPKLVGYFRKYKDGTNSLKKKGWIPHQGGPKDDRGLREFVKGTKKAYVCFTET